MARVSGRTKRPLSRPPDAASLHEAALSYLARFAATEAGLCRVLDRRVERWARAAAESIPEEAIAEAVRAARGQIGPIVARLAAAGAVDDAAFAAARARRLAREGKSRRAVAAHLAAKGVGSETAAQVLPTDAAGELTAALIVARRRRIGPFRDGPSPDPAGLRRELGILARRGFSSEIAGQALTMSRTEAEEALRQLSTA